MNRIANRNRNGRQRKSAAVPRVLSRVGPEFARPTPHAKSQFNRWLMWMQQGDWPAALEVI
jgi:hypothetical protein